MKSERPLMTSTKRAGRPRRGEAEAISAHIIDAATDTFLTQGFEKASMDAIAAGAGVSKATLYSRYSGKADLFEAVIGKLGAAKIAELEALTFEGGGSLRSELLALARRVLAIMIEPRVIAMERVVAGEAHQFPRLAARIYGEEGERVLAIVAALLDGIWRQNGRRRRAKDDMQTRIFLALVILAPLRRAILDGDGENAVDDRFLECSIDVFLKGTTDG